MTALLYTTNDTVKVLDYPDNPKGMEWFEKQIGCEYVEIVRPFRLPRGYVMLVDEMGLYTEKKPNSFGSYLYGFDMHHQPIIGDILIVMEKNHELCGMDDVERARLMERFDLHVTPQRNG